MSTTLEKIAPYAVGLIAGIAGTKIVEGIQESNAADNAASQALAQLKTALAMKDAQLTEKDNALMALAQASAQNQAGSTASNDALNQLVQGGNKIGGTTQTTTGGGLAWNKILLWGGAIVTALVLVVVAIKFIPKLVKA